MNLLSRIPLTTSVSVCLESEHVNVPNLSFIIKEHNIRDEAASCQSSRLVYGKTKRSENGKVFYPLPPKWSDPWKYEQTSILVTQKDAALAATNSLGNAWKDVERLDGMCHTHVCIRWFTAHKANFRDRSEEYNILMNDLNYGYRHCPLQRLASILKVKMLDKWSAIEPEVAQKWDSSWHGALIPRVEMNPAEASPLRGGIPDDNNAVESGNYEDKRLLNYKKISIVLFLPDLVNILSGESREDIVFVGKMKPKGHSYEFYKHCETVLTADTDGKPTFTSVQFKFTSKLMMFPRVHDLSPQTIVLSSWIPSMNSSETLMQMT
jgi:hypothetical protein